MNDEVQRFLERRIDAGWMPGAAWWIEGPRGLLARGAAGRRTLEPEPERLTFDTPFDLASLTKPLVTALVAVLLEQDGILSLEDPVGAWVEELVGTAWEATTLEQLASHTAGLPAWRPLYLEATSLEGYLGALSLMPRTIEPGLAVYSDLGYIVLGAVLERATGDRLDVLFQTRIAVPLGLRGTGFATTPGAYAAAAATERGNAYERVLAGAPGTTHAWRTGMLRGEVHDANAHALGGVSGHAGLFAPVEEVAALVRELVHPWRLPLGPGALRRLLDVAPSSRDRTVGFVTARASRAARGILPDAAVGHTGFTGTSIWLDPGAARFWVLLTNRVHPSVPHRDFQLLRRGFHRLARETARRV